MKELKHVHILGIGGCACSAIGEYLCEKGICVTGSERAMREDLGYLEEKGIKIVKVMKRPLTPHLTTPFDSSSDTPL